jgi:hypothetical protein
MSLVYNHSLPFDGSQAIDFLHHNFVSGDKDIEFVTALEDRNTIAV